MDSNGAREVQRLQARSGRTSYSTAQTVRNGRDTHLDVILQYASRSGKDELAPKLRYWKKTSGGGIRRRRRLAEPVSCRPTASTSRRRRHPPSPTAWPEGRVMGGAPCIRGTCIPVATIAGMMAEGMDRDEVLRDYPHLSAADVTAAVQYVTTGGKAVGG